MKLTACYITKNEEKTLACSLDSIREQVDEILVVDTGSTDETIKVARKYGAQVSLFDWQDDFAAARNAALEQASGDWIVFLDADEYFTADTAGHLRRFIEQQDRASQMGCLIKIVHIDADAAGARLGAVYGLRAFRRVPELRYVGRIHEELRLAGGGIRSLSVAPARELRLEHTGYSSSQSRSKAERNLRLLLAELAVTEQEERLYGYLADAYLGLGQEEKAAYYARLAVASGRRQTTEASRPYRILLQLLAASAPGGAEHRQTAAQAVLDFPELPEFHAEYAQCLALREAYQAAVVEMQRALQAFRDYTGLEPMFFTADMVRQAQRQLAEWQSKVEVPRNPQTADQLLQQLTAAREAKDMEQALQAADILFWQYPDYVSAMESVTSLYIDVGDFALAACSLQSMCRVLPVSPYRLYLQARVEHRQMKHEAAIAHAEQALQYPDIHPWEAARLHNILGRLYREVGETEQAAAAYLAASACPDYAGRLDDYSNYLFCLHYREQEPLELLNASRRYDDFFSFVVPCQHLTRQRHEKLRIGYISPDIRKHVVLFFSQVMFQEYDPVQFEVYCYMNGAEDEQSREIAAAVAGWRNIQNLSSAEAARQIYEDEIDILVDLAGHTANNCLPVLAYHPAPVQISGIGWFDTTGLQAVDYFLADRYTDPEGLHDARFTEKLLRLPHSHFCYRWHDTADDVQETPCQSAGTVTFGCLNNFAKITDELLALWADILRELPDARLLLKGRTMEVPYGRQQARRRLRQAGIPLERVEFSGFTKAYLNTYQRIDIALDTYPYPGGGTTCDALYMGVPVITRVGERHGARFGYSLLMNMGLGELCAFTPEEYVAKAVALARDTERLQTLHQTLRRRMRRSALMDEGQYMGELEQAYQTVWQDWLYEGAPAAARAKAGRQIEHKLIQAMKRQDWEMVRRLGGRLTGAGQVSAQAVEAMGLAYSYGESLLEQKRAVYWLRRAVQLTRQNLGFLYGILAEALEKTRDYAGAYEAVHMALAHIEEDVHFTRPEYRQSLYAHQAKLALSLGCHEEAMSAYRQAAEAAPSLEGKASMYSSLLLTAHYLPLKSAELFTLHQGYASLLTDIVPLPPRQPGQLADGRLHIGYLSPDFRQHVLFAFYYALLFCYDHDHFHVTCYSRSAVQDGFTGQIRSVVDAFVDVSSLSLAETAQRIRDDGIDILVDLAGHSADSGLPVLAWKPAPVQISGLGYMATTGLPAVDYFLTDEIVDPPGEHEAYFTENLLYLPSQFSYTGRNDVPVSTGAPCRGRGYVVFGVFNRYRKITDEMLLDWQVILEQVPGSWLLLKSEELGSDSLTDLAYERLKQLGLPMERILFEPSTADYMERYLAVDIALDTYPYPGGGTTCDALYMGVPVITRYGERRNTRFGLSILQNVGLGELAAASREEYIARAVGLAKDRELLDVLHTNLRQMMQKANALEPRHYMHELEQRYRQIWQTYQQEGNSEK